MYNHKHGVAQTRMGGEATYKLFLSSPTDVSVEREAAKRVVWRINAERLGKRQIELLRWEDSYYTADKTFQDQIEAPGDCDLVVCLFWKSLGNDLPETYRMSDGRLPTGTEYEFENALNHSLASEDRQPDVLVYRKTADVYFKSDMVAIEQAQQDRLLSFWRRWFHNEKGQFVAGFHTFEDTSEFETLFEDHLAQWLSRREVELTWRDVTPYIGLRPFGPKDTSVFFGRDREILRARARLIANALNGRNVLAVVGPSGSGKSSLVSAGLMPSLTETRLTADRAVLSSQITLKPSSFGGDEGAGWAQGLSTALLASQPLGAALAQGDFANSEALAALMSEAPESAVAPFSSALDRLQADRGTPQGVIVFMDQFEEVFAFSDDHRDAFILALTHLVGEERINLIMAMRSEFLARVQDSSPLSRLFGLDGLSDGSEPFLMLRPPEPGDLRDIITGPAKGAGVAFEAARDNLPALEHRIEADAADAPLPAVQFLLSELFAGRDGDVMTHDCYDRLGGVAGVIARRGDAALKRLISHEERRAFPSLIRKLVANDGLTNAFVSRTARRTSLSQSEETVSAALIEEGLLIADGAELRLAHEVLISGWDAVSDIVEDDKRLLGVRHRLSIAANAHDALLASSKPDAEKALLQGFPLEEGKDLIKAWDSETVAAEYAGLPAFIAASVQASHRRSRNRILAISTAATAIMAALVVAFFFQIRSAEAERRAELGTALSKASDAAFRYEDWPTAIEQARRARDLADNSASLSLALSVVLGAGTPFDLPLGNLVFDTVRFGYDGKLRYQRRDGADVFVGRGDTEIRLPPQADQAGHVLSNGALLAVNQQGRVWYDQPDEEGFWLGELGAWGTNAWQFEETASHFLVSQTNIFGGLTLLSCPKRSVQSCQVNDFGDVETLGFTSSAGTVTAMIDGTDSSGDSFQFGFLDGTQKQFRHSSLTELFDLDFAKDGSGLVWGTRQGDVYYSHELSRTTLLFTSNATQSPSKVSSSTDGQILAFTCGDEEVCVGQVSDETAIVTLKFYGAFGGIRTLSLSPDGLRVLVHLADGRAKIWSTTDQMAAVDVIPFNDAKLHQVFVPPDTGSIIATFDNDFARLIKVQDRNFEPLIPWPDGLAKTPEEDNPQPSVSADVAFTLDPAYSATKGEDLFARSYLNTERVFVYSSKSAKRKIVELKYPPHRLAFAEDDALLATSARSLERYTFDGGVELLEENPEGLGIGGVVSHNGVIYYGLSNGAIMAHGQDDPVVPPEDSADSLAPLSLDIHPQGRFLVASRADKSVLIHDLEAQNPPVRLSLPTLDNKVVAFSPSGAHVAVLTTAGSIGVWQFDPNTGDAEPHLFVDPVPQSLRKNSNRVIDKGAIWMVWLDDKTLGVASDSSDFIMLPIDADRIDAELGVLSRAYSNFTTD